MNAQKAERRNGCITWTEVIYVKQDGQADKVYYAGTDHLGSIVKIRTNAGITMTDNTGKKQTLYFDSLFLKDSLVYGRKSHFITLPVTPMNINNLTEIKIQ